MPSIPANLDWLFYAIGGVIALGSVWLLIWALFRDRARAKFRCPKCWYDLTGAEGAAPNLPVTCSECGRATTRIKHLRKTRARWRYALLAVALFLTSGAVAYYPSAHRNGWLSIVPTRFLIDSMPVFGYPTFLSTELVGRCGYTQTVKNGRLSNNRNLAPSISNSDYAYLAHRVARGNWLARPISRAWQRSFGQFHEDYQFALFDLGFFRQSQPPGITDPAVRAAVKELYDIPMQLSFRTRPVWPEGNSLYVEVQSKTWWPWPCADRIVVRDRRTNEWHEASNPYGFVIEGLIGQSRGAVRLDARIQWKREAEEGADWVERNVRWVSVPYRIEGSIDQIITPVVDPSIDQLVGSIVYEVGRGWLSVHVAPTCTAQTKGMAFGIIMEHLLDGELQAVERFWWCGGAPKKPGLAGHEREWVADPRLQPRDQRRSPWSAKPGENWTVRIRSDPETALRVIDADKYWQGDVTVNLTIK